ncbi:hypothetical protein BRC21_00830 [Candidatus Saccharibacteria bacterium SW_7_54_9]|nr:MAG: hypothetical protein BRC21_00830 [Candidatus Saccharibacteria bacterium SW_7_54_9]
MSTLRTLTRRILSPSVARQARKWGGAVRFRQRMQKARDGYRKYSDTYPYPLLFVAGLPKSGTSWLESMLASYPGYQHLVIPEAVQYELKRGGSHDFDLPEDTANRFEDALVVLKLHVHGSAHNARLLHEAEVPYVVLYRDLRDVAVSHYFYVRRTPWHPEYEDYAELDIEEALLHFGRTLLPDFVDWMQSWRGRRDSDLSLELRYEDLLDDTEGEFGAVASHFGLDDSPPTIERIVAEHRFENMTDGRLRGEEDEHSFVRKGVAGDWQTHFTDRTKDLFKTHAGQALIDFGYESDLDW